MIAFVRYVTIDLSVVVMMITKMMTRILFL